MSPCMIICANWISSFLHASLSIALNSLPFILIATKLGTFVSTLKVAGKVPWERDIILVNPMPTGWGRSCRRICFIFEPMEINKE